MLSTSEWMLSTSDYKETTTRHHIILSGFLTGIQCSIQYPSGKFFLDELGRLLWHDQWKFHRRFYTESFSGTSDNSMGISEHLAQVWLCCLCFQCCGLGSWSDSPDRWMTHFQGTRCSYTGFCGAQHRENLSHQKREVRSLPWKWSQEMYCV